MPWENSRRPSSSQPAEEPPRRPRRPLRRRVRERGDAIGVEPQRERRLQRDDRPRALREDLRRPRPRRRLGAPLRRAGQQRVGAHGVRDAGGLAEALRDRLVAHERRVVREEVRRVLLQVPLDAARAAEAALAREARAVVDVAFEVLEEPAELATDVAVVGGGSAGFAAAWNAARLGSSVVLVERADRLGGTSTVGGVSNWEPDCGATGTPRIVYERMRRKPNAAGVYVIDRHCSWDDPKKTVFPGALCVIDPSLDYGATLRRHGPGMGDKAWFRENCHGVIFEPDALADTMREMLDETGRCRTLLNPSFVAAEKDAAGNVRSLVLSDGTVIRPKIVIDAGGMQQSHLGPQK